MSSTGLSFDNFEALQSYLELKNERVVFIIDGLEELFQNISKSTREKVAVRALCQGIVYELRSFPDGRIGMIVFARRDVAMNAIEQNWGQFYAQYSQFELIWTNVEALRLALWLASSVDSSLKPTHVPIENAMREVLEESLYPLWGIKLGKPNSKEAYSANWILAVLSDLNEQLQARDVVRFLRYAAEESKRTIVTDRYLAPAAIKNAIQPCSEQKITEISQEMPALKEIFDKLKVKPIEQRQVPFQLEEYSLTNEEARMMEQQGYLVKLDDGYYMPEIIRRGLDLSLQREARPKVFTLLKRVQYKK